MAATMQKITVGNTSRSCFFLVMASLALSVYFTPALAQNLLANPGFEDPISAAGAPAVGEWESGAGAGASAANSASMPRSGAQAAESTITGTPNTFAIVFQDVPGLVPGQDVVFSGYHKTLSNADGNQVRIEWRDAANAVEIGRTANLTPAVSADYTPFSLTSTVPAGAAVARVVYAIQSFEGPSSQQVFVDDTAFVVTDTATAPAASWHGLAVLVAILATLGTFAIRFRQRTFAYSQA